MSNCVLYSTYFYLSIIQVIADRLRILTVANTYFWIFDDDDVDDDHEMTSRIILNSLERVLVCILSHKVAFSSPQKISAVTMLNFLSVSLQIALLLYACTDCNWFEDATQSVCINSMTKTSFQQQHLHSFNEHFSCDSDQIVWISIFKISLREMRIWKIERESILFAVATYH